MDSVDLWIMHVMPQSVSYIRLPNTGIEILATQKQAKEKLTPVEISLDSHSEFPNSNVGSAEIAGKYRFVMIDAIFVTGLFDCPKVAEKNIVLQ